MDATLNLLIVDDNEDDALLVARCISKGGHMVRQRRVDTAEDMAAALATEPWDAVIADVNMPKFSAQGALEIHRRLGCDCPFIVVSGVIGEEAAVTLLKGGADDFVLKTNLARLVPALERELREAAMRRAGKAAEEALRISQERYTLAAQGANDGLWDWALVDGRVYYSSRWKAMLGYGENEVAPCLEGWLGLVHPDDRPAVERVLDEHLAGVTENFASEHRLRHRDGGWRWMLARGVAVRDADRKPYRMAGSLTDITALKLANEQLRRAITTKVRFLAAASHDLRQPIQALFCFSSILLSQLSEHPAHRTAVHLDNSLKALGGLLDSMVDISRLDAGIVTPDISDVEVAPLLARLQAELGMTAADKNIKLRCHAGDEVVRSDPVLLGRIIRNLMDNAIRYTNAGGVLVCCRRRAGQVSIEVWDTGVGVTPEQQEHIFEEFFQVGNPERDRAKGLGLGLSIVERLSHLLDHTIEFRSVPGRGSMFRVVLPVGTPPPGDVDRPPIQMSAEGTIVVIDDDQVVAASFAQLLAGWGYDTIASGSAEEAIATLQDSGIRPRVIVADYRLRDGHTGVEAVRLLRQALGTATPAVIVTGDTVPGDIDGLPVLQKPVSSSDIQATLAKLAAEGDVP
jgi:two-component system, sensor histidine kinase